MTVLFFILHARVVWITFGSCSVEPFFQGLLLCYSIFLLPHDAVEPAIWTYVNRFFLFFASVLVRTHFFRVIILISWLSIAVLAVFFLVSTAAIVDVKFWFWVIEMISMLACKKVHKVTFVIVFKVNYFKIWCLFLFLALLLGLFWSVSA